MTAMDYTVPSHEEEMAMAYVEDMMNEEIPDMDTEPYYDELHTGLTFGDMCGEIHESCYANRQMPEHVTANLMEKQRKVDTETSFSYQTLFVEPIINAQLKTKEPAWFNPRRVMPDLDDQVMRLVIGKGGCRLKEFDIETGAAFIWYDRQMKAFKLWGLTPTPDSTYSIDDVVYNLENAIKYQAMRRYDVALSRLHRSCERRQEYRSRTGRLVVETRPRSPSSESTYGH